MQVIQNARQCGKTTRYLAALRDWFNQMSPREYMQIPQYHALFESLGFVKDIA